MIKCNLQPRKENSFNALIGICLFIRMEFLGLKKQEF